MQFGLKVKAKDMTLKCMRGTVQDYGNSFPATFYSAYDNNGRDFVTDDLSH